MSESGTYCRACGKLIPLGQHCSRCCNDKPPRMIDADKLIREAAEKVLVTCGPTATAATSKTNVDCVAAIITDSLAPLLEERERLRDALVACDCAMGRSVKVGATDHLDCCEDGGEFWYGARRKASSILNPPTQPADEIEKEQRQ